MWGRNSVSLGGGGSRAVWGASFPYAPLDETLKAIPSYIGHEVIAAKGVPMLLGRLSQQIKPI